MYRWRNSPYSSPKISGLQQLLWIDSVYMEPNVCSMEHCSCALEQDMAKLKYSVYELAVNLEKGWQYLPKCRSFLITLSWSNGVFHLCCVQALPVHFHQAECSSFKDREDTELDKGLENTETFSSSNISLFFNHAVVCAFPIWYKYFRLSRSFLPLCFNHFHTIII